MSAPPVFRLTDVPRAIAFFLDRDRRRYLFFVCVLGVVQFYPMLPPYLIGRVADFLLGWQRGDSLTPLYALVGTLGVAHACVALVRLSTKRVIGRMAIDARMRAKVWGFERLLDFSLAWHQKESTGNKAQRVITGADAVRDWTSDLVNALLTASGAFFGALIACMLLHPATALFFLYYCGVLGFIEWYFYRRIARLSDQINASMENASGSFVESAANILSVKAMNAAADTELKRLAAPASVDSIPSSAMQEDHVSMGWSAGRKLRRAVDGLARVLAIEVLTAARGLQLRAPLAPAAASGAVVSALVEAGASAPGTDRWLAPEIETAYRLVVEGSVRAAAERHTGPLG